MYSIINPYWWCLPDQRRIAVLPTKKKDIKKLSPKDALEFMSTYKLTDKKIVRKFEKIIAKDEECSYTYAMYVLDNRFILGEKTIIKSENYEIIYKYCRYIIRDRDGEKKWLEAEPIIFKNVNTTFRYIKNIVKDVLPEAEETLLKSETEDQIYDLYLYCRDYKGQWLEAEPIIFKNPYETCKYVIDVIKKEYPPAEKFILQDIEQYYVYSLFIEKRNNEVEKFLLEKKYLTMMQEYIEKCIKGRWEEAEPIIAKCCWHSLNYAKFIQDKFPLGEETIKKDKIAHKEYQKLLKSINKKKKIKC